MKKHLWKYLAVLIIVIATVSLAFALPLSNEQDKSTLPTVTEETPVTEVTETDENKNSPEKEDVFVPEIAEKNDNVNTEESFTCTLSVRCDTIIENMHLLKEEKRSLVPENGVIFYKENVPFQENDSVFDVLLREMTANHIHMEYQGNTLYNTAYIEGIGNLYEFDLGSFSGWRYKVNGNAPNYGCSDYKVSDKDKIEWEYSCGF